MIGFLRGQVLAVNEHLLLDVGGVGYLVLVGSNLLSKAALKSELELYIHTFVREDRFELYGFEQIEQKRLFLLLLGVSGIGPKTALAISDLGAAVIRQAVQEANIKQFMSVSRVGKSLAQKIIIELKPKLGGIQELELGDLRGELALALDGLVSLGIDEQQARRVLDQIEKHQAATDQELDLTATQYIKLALQEIGQQSQAQS